MGLAAGVAQIDLAGIHDGAWTALVNGFNRDVPRAPHLMVFCCTLLLCSRGMLQALEVVAALPPLTVDRPCPPALWVGALGFVVSCHGMCTTTHTPTCISVSSVPAPA